LLAVHALQLAFVFATKPVAQASACYKQVPVVVPEHIKQLVSKHGEQAPAVVT